VALSAAWTQEPAGQTPDLIDKLHLLVVADNTAQGGKELGLDLDGQNVAKIFQTALDSQGLKGRYTITTIKDGDVSPRNILKHYFELQNVGPNDALAFYYTGHGGFEVPDGHVLTTSKGNLQHTALMNVMGRLHPKLMVVLTDCCSNASRGGVDFPGGVKRDAVKQSINLKKLGKGEVCRDLFFRTQGIVNITAALTGTVAGGNRKMGGSYFTIALTSLLGESPELFDDNRDRRVGWKEFFSRLDRQTGFISFSDPNFPQWHFPEAFMLPDHEPNLIIADTKDLQHELTGGLLYSAAGDLNVSDPKLADRPDSHVDTHEVEFQANEAYVVELNSAQFDGYLVLQDAQGKKLAENDDRGKDVTKSILFFQAQQAGKYKLQVTSYAPKELGAYSLSVQRASYFAQGKLDSKDPQDRFCKGAYFKIFPLKLVAGTPYVIDLSSTTLDPYLRVEDEYGTTLALSDDMNYPANTDSQLVFRPSYHGTYRLVVTTFLPKRPGEFILSVRH